jgi:hypothetical protein
MAVSLEEALATEVQRTLETIDGADPFRTSPRTITDAPASLEDLGARGLPAIVFAVDGAQPRGAATGRVRLGHPVRFWLFARADASANAKTNALALKADVQAALMREWKSGTTAENVVAATGADFVAWNLTAGGATTTSLRRRGDAWVLGLQITATVQRDFDRP